VAEHPDALRDRLRGRRIGVQADGDELVSSDAADRIIRAHAVREAVGDRAQHLVADRVAVRVVDGLELVDVEEHHRQGQHVVVRRGDRGGEVLLHGLTVGKPGEGVGQSEVLQPALEAHAHERLGGLTP
jgi:hypothetical protein